MDKQEAIPGKLDFSKIEAEAYVFYANLEQPKKNYWRKEVRQSTQGESQDKEFYEVSDDGVSKVSTDEVSPMANIAAQSESNEHEANESVPYSSLDEHDKYSEKNRKIVEKINSGEPFSIAIGGEQYGDIIPLFWDQGRDGEAFYSLVGVGDMRMPFPLLELGLGEKVIDQPFVQHYDAGEDGLEYPCVACTKVDFENWMRGHFGEQFTGFTGR